MGTPKNTGAERMSDERFKTDPSVWDVYVDDIFYVPTDAYVPARWWEVRKRWTEWRNERRLVRMLRAVWINSDLPRNTS